MLSFSTEITVSFCEKIVLMRRHLKCVFPDEEEQAWIHQPYNDDPHPTHTHTLYLYQFPVTFVDAITGGKQAQLFLIKATKKWSTNDRKQSWLASEHARKKWNERPHEQLGFLEVQPGPPNSLTSHFSYCVLYPVSCQVIIILWKVVVQ